MAQRYDYDVMVIGAGIAGFVSAVTVNSLGKRVAIVEKRKLGGNCTNFTCIPSKALIRMSHVSRELATLNPFREQEPSSAGLDSRHVMDRVRAVTGRIYEKDLPETFEEIGIHVLHGTAAFVDRHHIEVDGRRISSEKFILATGTRPLVPPIPGLREIDYLTNENLYELEQLPRSILILGGGVDGFEYASAFGRLGVSTTVVEMATRLMPTADREMVSRLLRVLTADGIRFLTGAKAVNLSKEKHGVVLTYEQGEGKFGEVQGERVLVTIGRRPDTEGLMLEKAGVVYNQRGIITDDTLRTSVSNIYACGDIVGPYQLASMAEYQGMIAATNTVLPVKRKVDYSNNVYVTFTEPTLAQIGLPEEQAHQQYWNKLRVYRIDYDNMRRAVVDGTDTGVAKFICDEKGSLVGVHILGEGAPDVIHEVQLIRALNQPLYRFHSLTHAYPTYAQALVGRASQLAFLDRMARSFWVKIALALLPGCSNKLALARDRLAETEPVVHENAREEIRAEFLAESFMAGRGCMVKLPSALLDYDEAPLLLSCKTACGGKDPQEIILDFSSVCRINALGIFMLIKLVTMTRKAGQRLKAFRLSTGLRDVFTVTELGKGISVFDNAAAVLPGQNIRQDNTEAGSTDSNPFENAKYWAKSTEVLNIVHKPIQARALNVEGLRVVGPMNGFGQLWQKVYRLHIADQAISPDQAIHALMENFPAFQPHFNHFYPSPGGLKPGEIVLFDAMTPGGPVSSGVFLLYADERSFTFMTPQGHPESGMIDFSAYRSNSKTIVQIVGLARANDPLYEGAFRMIGSKMQARIWIHVLTSLAIYLGVPAAITIKPTCVDDRLQWSQCVNLWHNAQIRTLFHEPIWWMKAPFRGRVDKP